MSITYNEDMLQIITDALELIGYLAAGETVAANDITFCSNILNKMLKAWEAQGIHLWTVSEGTLFFVQNQGQYILSATNGANASDGTGTPIETTLSSIGSGTTVNVVSSIGMTVGDNIGVCQDSQIIFWSTIASINNNAVTMNAPLTSSASQGNAVYTYTNNLGKALSIQSARLRNSSGFDRTVKIIPHNDYMMIPQKSSSSSPTVLSYLPQVSSGIVYVWPCPSDVNSRMEITYLRTIIDLVNTTDMPDLPQEWLEAITYNLAVRLASAYGISLSSQGLQGNPSLLTMAAQFLEELKAWDAEQPYVCFVPNYRYNR